jgi:nucleoside-diphosphate-sugar epimerase
MVMKVLVTGACRGLGRNAVEYLCHKGISVRATGSNPAMAPLLEKIGAEFILADLNDLLSTQAKRLLAEVDTIWHCAGECTSWGHDQSAEQANVRATRRLGEWASAYGVKQFVHLSSSAIYFDFRHHHLVSEDYQPQRYASAFAHSKALAEQVIVTLAQANPQTHFTILRPHGLFGPHDSLLVPRLLQMVHHNKLTLPRGGETLLDMTYMENALHAMWLASDNPHTASGRAYNIANKHPCTLRDLLLRLMDILPLHYQIRSMPYPLLDMLARSLQKISDKTGKTPSLTHYLVARLNFDLTLNTQRAQQELNYSPVVSYEESILRTAHWLQQHGRLPHLYVQ